MTDAYAELMTKAIRQPGPGSSSFPIPETIPAAWTQNPVFAFPAPEPAEPVVAATVTEVPAAEVADDSVEREPEGPIAPPWALAPAATEPTTADVEPEVVAAPEALELEPEVPAEPLPVADDTAEPELAPVFTFSTETAVERVVPEPKTQVTTPPPPPRTPLATLTGDFEPNEWLDHALRNLVAAGASDVHLTMNQHSGDLQIEARRDGDIEEVRSFNSRSAQQILNMLKTKADVSTSSNRVPDDGSYPLPIDGFPYRIRAVALPLVNGEKVVLRLPQTGELRTLDQLGLTETTLRKVRELLSRPSGLFVIAGPMGEGKTTTAHAAILEIGTSGKSVFAVEDPVERVLPTVAQMEVNEDVGAGFGDIMKFLVRSDFDTLFIGEIRDSATAAAAVRLAKAGRRVISTIHASDNVTAILRLIELSDDTPLSVLDAVAGVVSQRLLHKLNPDGNGYLGRHPIHEVLTVNDEFVDRMIENKSLGAIRDAAAVTSTTFADNLRELIDTQVTDAAEARRVLGHDV